MNYPRHRGRKGPLPELVPRFLLLCVLCGLAFSAAKALAQGGGVSEYAVKAAFVAKFAQFVKWPSGGGSPTVGVLGEDPFGGALDRVARVKRSGRVDDLKSCQIVFISKSGQNVGGALSSLAGTNVLTVGESDGFAKQGGIIGFTMDGDKVRFEINLGAARRNGLTVDPQLSQLAVRVFK